MLNKPVCAAYSQLVHLLGRRADVAAIATMVTTYTKKNPVTFQPLLILLHFGYSGPVKFQAER